MYRCLNAYHASCDATFEENSGLQNPYRYLRACYEKGKRLAKQENSLSYLFNHAKEQMTAHSGTIFSHFVRNTLRNYNKVMHDRIRLIDLKTLP